METDVILEIKNLEQRLIDAHKKSKIDLEEKFCKVKEEKEKELKETIQQLKHKLEKEKKEFLDKVYLDNSFTLNEYSKKADSLYESFSNKKNELVNDLFDMLTKE